MELDDRELVRKLQEGDGEALRRLIKRHERPLYSYLLRLLRDRASAEDAFSEVWMRVWTRVGSYRETGRLRAWVFTIAHRIALDHLERARRGPLALDVESGEGGAAETLADSDLGPAGEAEASLFRERVAEAMERLPEEQRQVFLLREYGGLTFAEIADAMDCPLGTALARMRYAVRKLRKDLEGLDA